MLSRELERFYQDWREKASRYNKEEISDYYDKFFTLFVVFNRLYAEATFELARRGEITIHPDRPLPDRKGATEYCFKMIGLNRFETLYKSKLASPIAELEQYIQDEKFYIKLSVPDGDPQRAEDLELLERLRKNGDEKYLAILDVVYTIRCNMFHGHKSFTPLQIDLLRPTINILQAVIEELYSVLNPKV